jgi:hypothetical protein
MARRTYRRCRIDFKFTEKVIAPMRNNSKTSVIDGVGYNYKTQICLAARGYISDMYPVWIRPEYSIKTYL